MSKQEMSAAASNGSGGWLGAFDRIYAKLENATNWMSAATIMALMFLAVYQIAGRRILNAPIFGYIDFIEQFMIIFAISGIAYCQRLGGHVRMELIINRLGRGRLFWITEAGAIVVGLIFIGVLIPASFDHFLRAWELGDSTINAELPLWPAKLLIPVSLGILWIRLLLNLLGYLRLIADPTRPPVAVPVIQDIEDEAAREIHEALGDEVEVAFTHGGEENAPR